MEINCQDAEKLGITDGDLVEVASRRGEIQIKARITGKIKTGVIFIPFHFAECAANVLTNPAFDPIAKIPELKVCAAAIRPAR